MGRWMAAHSFLGVQLVHYICAYLKNRYFLNDHSIDYANLIKISLV